MKMTETETTQQNHNTTYNVVHPQCRGYVHKLRFIPLSSKPQFICAHSCRFLLPFDSRAHSSRLLRTQLQIFLSSLQNPSAHTAAEVVHAHSWDLSFPYKIRSYLPYLFLHQKA